MMKLNEETIVCKDVLVDKWEIICGIPLILRDIRFPDKCPVTIEFDKSEIVGWANNFRTTDEGIVADVFLEKRPVDTIAPLFKVNDCEDSDKPVSLEQPELLELSLVNCHNTKECNGNLKKCGGEEN